MASTAKLAEFGEAFGESAVLVAIYLVVYAFVTQHNEFALIRANVLSAAVALGMSFVGFAVSLASAIIHTRHMASLAIWGILALVIQILVYWAVRVGLPDLSRRIAAGEVTAALFLGCASLAAGIIDAAAMAY